jgi:dolichyl-phosphate beta-glucosyltransferase
MGIQQQKVINTTSMYLSVIIPAYNEASRIGSTLRAVDAYLRDRQYEYEIIVVNDGSQDNTAEVVEDAMKDIPRLRLINNKNNHGKGWVVRKGMLSAKGLFRLFMDADNSTSIENLEQLFPYAKQGYDVIASSRRIAGAEVEVHQNWLRNFLGAAFRLLVRVIVPVGVVDTQNGFKLFTARAAEEIFRRQRTFTWAFDVEVLAIAQLLDFSIKEVPIHWVNDGRSHVTFKGMVKMLMEVFQIRFQLWTNTYYSKVAEHISIG